MADLSSRSFQWSAPTRVIFGPGTRSKLRSVVDEAAGESARVFLVTGRHSLRAQGTLQEVLDALGEDRVTLFDRVTPFPSPGPGRQRGGGLPGRVGRCRRGYRRGQSSRPGQGGGGPHDPRRDRQGVCDKTEKPAPARATVRRPADHLRKQQRGHHRRRDVGHGRQTVHVRERPPGVPHGGHRRSGAYDDHAETPGGQHRHGRFHQRLRVLLVDGTPSP